MNRIYSWTALASLTLCSMGLVYGDPKLKADKPATEAKAVFEKIATCSDAISQEALGLRSVAFKAAKVEGDFDGLQGIKEDVNKIGSEVRSLEAMVDSLAPWEVEALAQTAPLMRQMAENTDQAIQASRQEPVPARSYIGNLIEISQNAEQIKTVLGDYLNLENTREKATRLEHSLGEESGK